MQIITIQTPYIKLDQLLKYAAVVGCGSEAKMLIQDRYIAVNGQVVDQRGKKIYPGDTVEINYKPFATTLTIEST